MDAGKTLREHGLRIGELEPGATASIADVAGVAVGHSTVGSTGVTALLPGPIEGLWAEPVPAGVAVLNGAGELTGSLQIAEWGRIETPVYLTATECPWDASTTGRSRPQWPRSPRSASRRWSSPLSASATTAG